MDKIIAQGKTTNEAIENGLKELKVSRNQVEIKVLEKEDKRSFFSILTPRVVKVELTLKETDKKTVNKVKEYDRNIDEIQEAKGQVEEFLNTFLPQMDSSLSYESKVEDYTIMIEIKGNLAGTLIGYRGETLNAMQNILSAIANKKASGKIKLTLDIENYREKLCKRYNLEENWINEMLKREEPENINIYEIMLEIGRRRGAIMSGGHIDEEKTARIILDDFRSGRIGKITLECVK